MEHLDDIDSSSSLGSYLFRVSELLHVIRTLFYAI
jgi:hypothetical protein